METHNQPTDEGGGMQQDRAGKAGMKDVQWDKERRKQKGRDRGKEGMNRTAGWVEESGVEEEMQVAEVDRMRPVITACVKEVVSSASLKSGVKSLKRAFFLTASRGRLQWLREKVQVYVSFLTNAHTCHLIPQ